MISPSAAQLAVAWIGSALAGAVAFAVANRIAMALLEVPFRLSLGFRVLLFALGLGLIFQLVYGGIIYVVLRQLALFNLPVILLAYLGPLIYITWTGSDVPKDIIMAIPQVTMATMLAIVGWYLVSSPLASN